MLKDAAGTWVRDENTLKNMTCEFFTNLYTTVGPRNFQPVLNNIPILVDTAMNKKLSEPVTMQEITAATYQLGASKALGPDGINGIFFQNHWQVINQDLFTEIQQFFETGILNLDLNKTVIVLIPKIPNPEKLEQFRLFSLCNFAYKIISKILTNRLKPLLPDLITAEQSAFVEGRKIQDNIPIVQEVLHKVRTREKKKRFQAVLKLDMQKAYDRIECDFLKECLTKMGFCGKWVQWIMQCVSTVSFSIRFNGDPTSYFKPTRGIRQGDPLSPYLFIIVANVLSYMMKEAIAAKSLKGIKLNRNCPTLSHLLFADDSILFLNGKVLECQNPASILHQYCYASAQAINLNKSGIYFSKGYPDSLKRNMAAELRVQEILKTGKYLGVPSD